MAQGHNKAMEASMKHVLLNIGVYIVSINVSDVKHAMILVVFDVVGQM